MAKGGSFSSSLLGPEGGRRHSFHIQKGKTRSKAIAAAGGLLLPEGGKAGEGSGEIILGRKENRSFNSTRGGKASAAGDLSCQPGKERSMITAQERETGAFQNYGGGGGGPRRKRLRNVILSCRRKRKRLLSHGGGGGKKSEGASRGGISLSRVRKRKRMGYRSPFPSQ